MKLAKLSLAAIMTVGALATTASATNLEDAIKGVDLSGYTRFRFNDKKNAEGTSEYKVQVQLSTPVQDNVQLVVRGTSSDSTATNAPSTNDVGFSADRVFINYTAISNTTITAGKQYLSTPLDDADGTGIKATYSVSGATLTGAYYSDTTINTQDISALIGAYSTDMFGFKGAYMHAGKEGLTRQANAYFLQANGSISPVSLVVQYAYKKTKGALVKDTTLHIEASGKFSNVGLAVGYIKNGKTGGDVALDGSVHGDNSLVGAGWAIEGNAADTNYYYGKVSTKMGKIGLGAEYMFVDLPNGAITGHKSELNAKVSYAVTNKLSTYVKYATVGEKNAQSTNKFRFEAKYSF